MTIKSFCILTATFLFFSCSTNQSPKGFSQIESTEKETIDISPEKVSELFKEHEEEYHEGLKRYVEDGKYGFLDSLGNIIIKAQFDNAGYFYEGLASVCIHDKYGFVDRSGKIIIDLKYDFANYFSHGLACVAFNKKYGYINSKGEVIIDFIYDDAHDFFDPEGFAAVRLNGKEGLIDRNGRIIMPIKYEHAFSTQDGVAKIYDGNKEYYIYNDGTCRIITY